MVPFLEALSATGGGGVLSDENRMVPHRSLPAVVRNASGSQSLHDKLPGMLLDGLESFFMEVSLFGLRQMKTPPKRRTR